MMVTACHIWSPIADTVPSLSIRAKENEALWSKFWNDHSWVIWERNDPKKVLYNSRKVYNCNLISLLHKNCSTAISFHNCKIVCRNNTKKCTTAISVHNYRKIVQLQNNAQLQKNAQLQNKFIAIPGGGTYGIWTVIFPCFLSHQTKLLKQGGNADPNISACIVQISVTDKTWFILCPGGGGTKTRRRKQLGGIFKQRPFLHF